MKYAYTSEKWGEMPLIPQQQLIHIDRIRYDGGSSFAVVEEFAYELIERELENYPPVKIVHFQITDHGIWVLVETV